VTEETKINRKVRRLERDQIGSYPRISLAGPPTKTYLQVLTPFDEIQTNSVQIYEQVKVGYGPMIGSMQLPILRTFIDTTWTTIYGEQIGEDPFGERFPDQYTKHRFLAVAVMVERHGDGFCLATIDQLDEHTGELRSQQAVGLLVEGIDFWQELFNHPDLYEGRIFQTVRHGIGRNRTFNFTPTMHSIGFTIPTPVVIDRAQVIEEWSSVERQREWVERMSSDWLPYVVRNPFQLRCGNPTRRYQAEASIRQNQR
jgi:hypothetical protein